LNRTIASAGVYF